MKSLNVENRTIFCRDNLDVMQGINDGVIDLIYLDPPFNKNKVFAAPIGSSAEGASFKDIFREEDLKEEWLLTIKEDNDKLHTYLEGVKVIEGRSSYNFCYLSYMAIRLLEMHRILKDTGSLYLHCDPMMSHYLKVLLDVIFGEKNFRNEIVWYYPNKQQSINKYKLLSATDIIFFFSKSKNHVIKNIKKKLQKETRGYEIREKGYSSRTISKVKYIDVYDWSKYRESKSIDKTIPTRDLSNKEYIKYYDNCWHVNIINSQSKERVGYPTQKPIALLERIIKVSSNKGDVVLDPFCGCATTCVASEKLDRKWIGIDVSVKAYDLVKQRLKKEVKGETSGGEQDLYNWEKEIHFTTSVPIRTDMGERDDVLKKYVYVISNERYPGEYKVGVASNYKARLMSYQTSDPNRSYRLEHRVLTHRFREVEKHIHDTFENRHEWVRARLEEIIQEIENYLKGSAG